MAHLPPKYLSGADPFSQPKTLFLPAPGTTGVLVTRTGRRFIEKSQKFADAHAALDWCQANNAALVFWQVGDPASN